MKRSLIFLCGLLGCSSEPSNDVVGPFTGEARRFVIDRFELPMNNVDARALAVDLDGDGTVDNQAGMVLGTLTTQDDVTLNAADMIASGALASVVVVQADDFLTDSAAGVTYFGSEAAPATVMGGRIEGGVFVSNRTSLTEVPGAAQLRLPVFRDADPIDVPLRAMQIDLAPDASGGYVARIAGCIPAAAVADAAFAGIVQMLANDPAHHLVFARLMDTNLDGELTREEFDLNSIFSSLLAPDKDFDGVGECLTIAFDAHLLPCPSGGCTEPPADPCHDRIVDGDETDVDCGGSCLTCTTAATCSVAADCQSKACDAGACRAPSCSDGARDGLESDIDCGGECGGCSSGATCASSGDCVEPLGCDGSIGSSGTCRLP
ncbi:MAG: hypothetical protein ABI867_07805 [Kofleriaceae bacterium]